MGMLEVASLVISLFLSIGAIVLSIVSWKKSRAIYGIEQHVIRQVTGGREDMLRNDKDINEKLSTGNYAILAILERTKSDKDWQAILGRIKPY